MPTSKKLYIKEGKTFKKGDLSAFQLKENLGSLKDIVILDEAVIKNLLEAAIKSDVKYSSKMAEMLKEPNTALICVIKAGWSMNGNYYDSASLKKLPAVMEAQGPIQFLNHLEDPDETKLDRSWEEIVSFTKSVWYDSATDAVYAIVRFPREKQDTNWIFLLMQDEPSLVGVSIDSAVYIQEDFEADGKKGDKILDWAFFNSADYVIFASAGGVAIEASAIQEKIQLYKTREAKHMKFTKEQVVAQKEQMTKMQESIKNFLTQYYDNQAYHEIQAVMDSLESFMFNIWWDIYDDSASAEQRIDAIKTSFEQASTILQGLEFWKNPGAQYDKDGKVIVAPSATQESNKPQPNPSIKESHMTLAELKAQHPEAFVALSQEAKTLAAAEINTALQESVTTLTGQVSTLDTELVSVKAEKVQLQSQIDTYKAKEALQTKKEAVLTAIEAAGFTPAEKEIAITPTFIKTLESMQTPEEVTASLEDRKTIVSRSGMGQSIEGKKESQKPASVIDEKVVADAFADIQS